MTKKARRHRQMEKRLEMFEGDFIWLDNGYNLIS